MKLRKLFGGSDRGHPGPKLQEGEVILRKGVGARIAGWGGRWGPMILTNRRLIWYETGSVWPMRRISGSVSLSEVADVDKGGLLDLVFGGRRIRMRLRNGKTEKLYEANGELDSWIADLRNASMDATESPDA